MAPLLLSGVGGGGSTAGVVGMIGVGEDVAPLLPLGVGGGVVPGVGDVLGTAHVVTGFGVGEDVAPLLLLPGDDVEVIR